MKLPKFIRAWLLRRAFTRHARAFNALRLARRRDAYSVDTPSEGEAYFALLRAQQKHRKAVALLSKRLEQFKTDLTNQ